MDNGHFCVDVVERIHDYRVNILQINFSRRVGWKTSVYRLYSSIGPSCVAGKIVGKAVGSQFSRSETNLPWKDDEIYSS